MEFKQDVEAIWEQAMNYVGEWKEKERVLSSKAKAIDTAINCFISYQPIMQHEGVLYQQVYVSVLDVLENEKLLTEGELVKVRRKIQAINLTL